MAQTTRHKQLPYGISDYRQIVEGGYYCVDKTRYLESMERAGNFLFLIRPRRFGKSLFLSMLRYYYDVRYADEFETLFGGTYVGEHPTALRNKYLFLHVDFSKVGGTSEVLEQRCYDYLADRLNQFAKSYTAQLGADTVAIIQGLNSYAQKLEHLVFTADHLRIPMYLIVDEYDNFTNNVLNAEGEEVYHTLTHAEGFYRDVFKKFKGSFARIMMMGVSPVTMDDVTSGFNIATALTLDERFNEMLGFCDDDVRQIASYYREAGLLRTSDEALLAAMRPWYDGYCFMECSDTTGHRVFNPDMVLYYLQSLLATGRPPRDMVDPNTRTDYVKLDRLIHLDRSDTTRQSVILEAAQDGYTQGRVEISFPAGRLTEPEMFKSLLYYYGMLTLRGEDEGLPILAIPNNNVRKQYYEYLLREYKKIHPVSADRLIDVFRFAAYRGDWRGMIDFICSQYRDTTSVRSLIEGERNLQGFMNAYLTLCPYYLTAPELELAHGYCDFFLLPDVERFPTMRHCYIVELKYLPVSATEADACRQWDEAVEQIRRYAAAPCVRLLTHGTTLHSLIVQIKGYEMVRSEEIALRVGSINS